MTSDRRRSARTNNPGKQIRIARVSLFQGLLWHCYKCAKSIFPRKWRQHAGANGAGEGKSAASAVKDGRAGARARPGRRRVSRGSRGCRWMRRRSPDALPLVKVLAALL